MENNKAILEKANAAILRGDYEGFLFHCTEDTKWTFVGEQTLEGKEAVRQWMAITYLDPPKFQIENLIAENNYVIAIGTIQLKGEEGLFTDYSYCDVWQFRNGKMVELRAFVIKKRAEK